MQTMNWLCVAVPDGPAAQGAALFLFALGEKFTFKGSENPHVEVHHLPPLNLSLYLSVTS